MAEISKMVPFIIRFEAGVSADGLTNAELFERARKSGFSNDPDDLGGATMIGVTLATYTEYCRRKGYPQPTAERLRAMSYGQWLDILKTMFWDRWRADEIKSQAVAEILVDWVWASGKPGITIPQHILGVAVDGVVGPKTLAAVNGSHPESLFARIKSRRREYIERICEARPANNKFRRGWLRRLDAIKFES